MKVLLASLLLLPAATACEISPVVSAPSDAPGIRFSDCERAAEDYCAHVLEAPVREMDACVAKHRFECLSSRADAAVRPRS